MSEELSRISQLTQSKAEAPAVVTDELQFKGERINRVADSVKTKSPYELITGLIFGELRDQMEGRLERLEVNSPYAAGAMLLGLPLWFNNEIMDRLQLWNWDDITGPDQAIFHIGFDQNSIVVPNSLFMTPGRFFVSIKVREISDGNLIIRDPWGSTILEIDKPGWHYGTFDFTTTNTSSISVSAENQLTTTSKVVIEFFEVYLIQDRLDHYLRYTISKIIEDEVADIATRVIEAQLAGEIEKLVAASPSVSALTRKVNDHLTAQNPHGIEAAQISAQPAGNYISSDAFTSFQQALSLWQTQITERLNSLG